ncbi:conserved hypothetical protein, contains Thioredoxin domain [Nitrospina gracilis 3/211]|uniref:Spermatogenesis-associated protein 20-like TRX domain-containing protein n=1 Tax=Nitrospina gracilis (strain 3/211) TaxID=1266370 RepID=M1YMS5_NITG3|nr:MULTISPECIES: thioredoxin domain-containing protein [Nitrospina]MCF8724587.1 uncharacterized protein YyaL (SSP411 family) [Nitrospina sp. Nb-3]CCQ91765.1 conserved hypothetical protein, contains Thioredoxin domain [Nitrospina gracilis 3/211]
MTAPAHTNRLKDETSPYLLQHAHNPVDWYPWGPEALDKAKREDKPIFLSIGYSSCHWCHVMAHESFESEETAKLMNELFVNIKVDREERPDIDAIYMKSVIALNGHGGWPMSVFLTPEQEPYLGGTYYPPEPKFNRPGFPQVLQQAADIYRNQKDRMKSVSARLMEKLTTPPPIPQGQGAGTDALIPQAVELMKEKFDETYGGFGSGMKFPEPMLYTLLLRHWQKREDNDAILMADKSLTKMAEGGMYDQVGGGFHRYSTDRKWLVPHFEKMLYDNALLARLFVEMFQATKQEIYERIAREVFHYIGREMTSPEWAFYSSQDADTDAGEGHFFTWTMKEVLDILGPRHSKVFARVYGMTATGNFEKRNVLHIAETMEKVSESEGVPIFEVDHIIRNGRQTLLESRGKRQNPGRDDKILTGWNGMMIAAFAAGAVVFRDRVYRDHAVQAARFLWDTMWKDGKLFRVYKDGKVRVDGCLEDYAWFIEGLLGVFEATGEGEWIDKAQAVADALIDRFWDDKDNGFFMTAADQEKLITRLKNPEDEAIPSANGVAALALAKLGRLTGKDAYFEKGRDTVRAFADRIEHRPTAYTSLLAAMDFIESLPMEVTISGPEGDPQYGKLLEAVYADYRPDKLVVRYSGDATVQRVPWAEGRGPVSGQPTVYVCRQGTCYPPVHDAEALMNQMGRPPHIKLNIFDEEKKVKDLESKEQANFLNAMNHIFKHSGLGKK